MKNNYKKVEEEMTIKELGTMIDQLAIATANGFNEVKGRLDRVESRLDSVESEVRGLRSDMDNGFSRFDREISHIHENYVRKDELRTLMLSTA